MPSKDIKDCVPELEKKAREFVDACAKAGVKVSITCTRRTQEEQEALYAQGRESLDIVNAKRVAVGLWRITLDENKRKVTWTLKSNHIPRPEDNGKCRAFDFVVKKDAAAVWDVKADIDKDGVADYEEAARIGESLGLRSGARFSTPDYPHMELPA